MLTGTSLGLRRVPGLDDSQKKGILFQLRNAVNTWCDNNTGDWFAVRDLFGGDNYDWRGSPMQRLYDKHSDNGFDHDTSETKAGIDAGWLMKEFLFYDERMFEQGYKGRVRGYRLMR